MSIDQELYVVITVEPEPHIFGPFASERMAFVWAQTTDKLDALDFVDIQPLTDPSWRSARLPSTDFLERRMAQLSADTSNTA